MRLTFCNRTRLLSSLVLTIAVMLGTWQARYWQHSTYHTMKSDDTLSTVAAQYAVSLSSLNMANGITNPLLIKEGQRLFIPSVRGVPGEGVITYPVVPGTLGLWQAALYSGNNLWALLATNNLDSPADAYAITIAAADRSGQPYAVPAADAPPTPLPRSTSVPTPSFSSVDLLDASLMGIQGHFILPENDLNWALDRVAYDLEVKWVKQQVNWSNIEYLPDNYSVELDTLDIFMHGAFQRGRYVMLSVAKAPDWTRSTTAEDGPPDNLQEYYDFLRFIVGRYKGKVQAIEVWNEPNLRREWQGGELSGAAYVNMLAGAYDAIKSVEPGIQVISAGLAPTGVNDPTLAVDDRLFFQQMYEAGLPQYVDGIGIHPYGWANPPWTRCCGDSGGVPTHNDDPRFFFLDTIEDYRAIQTAFGDEDTKLWATEFGWGSLDNHEFDPPQEQPFFAYVDEGEQATYIMAAFEIAQSKEYLGPMILWNLNVAALYGFDPNQAGYSIMSDRLDNPRDAFDRIAGAEKINK